MTRLSLNPQFQRPQVWSATVHSNGWKSTCYKTEIQTGNGKFGCKVPLQHTSHGSTEIGISMPFASEGAKEMQLDFQMPCSSVIPGTELSLNNLLSDTCNWLNPLTDQACLYLLQAASPASQEMGYEWYKALSIWPSLTVTQWPARRDKGAPSGRAQFYLWTWLSNSQNLVQFYLHQTWSLTLKVCGIWFQFQVNSQVVI